MARRSQLPATSADQPHEPPMSRLSLQIQVDADAGGLPAERRQIRRWVAAALAADAELVLRFVGTAEGETLNRQFRGRGRPTNVLTFEYEIQPVVKADIVICLPVVRAEAASQGKSDRDHLAHLVVHGVLHAQGQDHQDEDEAGRMEAREVAILKRFGIGDPYA
jgi:probable rRNA maturation factor